MSTERRPAGPTVYEERRHIEGGITSVLVRICAVEGQVTLVGGGPEDARRALVPELLAMANLVLRNPAEAAGLEVVGCITIAVHGSPLGVAVDDDGAVTMGINNRLTVSSASRQRPRYLAIAGGIEPHFGTQGPGHAVTAGQTLRPGGRRGLLVGGPGRIDLRLDDSVGVRPGSGVADGAFEALCRARCTVLPGGDRTALRLSATGAAFGPPAADGAAAQVARGAIVLAPDGTLLVAGPDHPPSPGARVLAIVDETDLGRLAAHAAGTSVTFAPR